MKKFEEEINKKVGTFDVVGHHNGVCCLFEEVKALGKDWVSPEDHQAEIAKIELQNLKYREEIARMQKSLRKKNKAIKELNGAVKKSKARLKDWHSDEEFQLLLRDRDTLKQGNDNLFKNHLELVEENDQLKSQLEKQQPEIPEVPQFVADWLDRKPIYAINGFIPVEIIEWSKKQTGYADLGMNINHLLKLKINGYTVAKEKRFYLKNKLTGQRLIRLLEENGGGFLECVTSTDKERMQFTQSEIDSMAADSYEQIEVEE